MCPDISPDYLHRVYAGVLGKLIGVYLGRPFENWTHQQILETLGPIHGYTHKKFNLPCVVIDDDVSGTFTFVRALEEHGCGSDQLPSSEDIGKTWLNNVIEKRCVFWWGGNGISTEHTAFTNLKHRNLKAPESGSAKTNGRTLAEQIGAQIFIDGWAMIAPGNPNLAAKLAEAAARVSHDGEAVNAAILWAVMEAEAFVSSDIEHLLDTGLLFIPDDSKIAKLISNIRGWHVEDFEWLKTRQRIEDQYGYDKHGGICHVIPNHGIMILALLYGEGDFDKSMHIVNTSGWDTDCNSGNVGCLVAIMRGLDAFEGAYDWRGPVADLALNIQCRRRLQHQQRRSHRIRPRDSRSPTRRHIALLRDTKSTIPFLAPRKRSRLSRRSCFHRQSFHSPNNNWRRQHTSPPSRDPNPKSQMLLPHLYLHTHLHTPRSPQSPRGLRYGRLTLALSRPNSPRSNLRFTQEHGYHQRQTTSRSLRCQR